MKNVRISGLNKSTFRSIQTRKGFYRNILAAIGVGALLSTSIPITSFAQTKLTFGSYLPEPHLMHKVGLEPLFQRIKEQTNGELEWELFVGGAMGGAKESLASIRDNIVDSSIVVDFYHRKDIAASLSMSDLITLTDDPKVFAAAMNETQLLECPQCTKEYDHNNVKPLAFVANGSYRLMCTDKIGTLSELENSKIRGAGRVGALAKALGGTPVSITTAEMYEGLQRGQVDCTIASADWLDSYNLKDVVQTIVDMPIGGYFGLQVMNLNKNRWEELSDSERTVVLKNMPKLIADVTYKSLESGDIALEAAKKAGAKFLAPDDKFKSAIEAFRKTEIPASVEKATGSGVEDAQNLLDTFMGNVEKWRKIVAQTNGDQDKYENALWEEIFSKL